MPRFKKGDTVFILPRFAHLYPAVSACVTKAKRDQFRSAFNGYTLQFRDGSNANVFEFQLIEDLHDYHTLVATIAFDSRRQEPTPVRGCKDMRRIVLHTSSFDIDMKIERDQSSASILGQVLERGKSAVLQSADISLLTFGKPRQKVTSDCMGIFKFESAPCGTANLLVVIPQQLVRIVGEIWV